MAKFAATPCPCRQPKTLDELKARFPSKPYEPMPRNWQPEPITLDNAREFVERRIGTQLNIPGLMAENDRITCEARIALGKWGAYPAADPELNPPDAATFEEIGFWQDVNGITPKKPACKKAKCAKRSVKRG